MSPHERERLAAWIDGELPPDEKATVEAHLSECKECAALLADLEAVDDFARDLPVEAPAGYFETFPTRVRERIVAAQGRRRRWRTPVWTWGAAAALLLAVVTPLTLSRLQEEARPPARHDSGERVTDLLLTEEGEDAAAVAANRPEAGMPSSAEVRKARAAAPGLELEKQMRREPLEEGIVRGDLDSPEGLVSTPPASGRAPEPPAARVRGTAVAPTFPAREAALDERDPDPFSAPQSASRPAAPEAPPAVAQEAASFAVAPPSDEESVVAEPRRPAGALLRVAPPGETTRDAPVSLEAEVADDEAQAALRRERLAGDEKAATGGRSDARGTTEQSPAEIRRLYRERPGDADGWREHRESWRAFAGAHPDSPWADEARMRTIEAGLEAWEAGGNPADRALALEDASAYLARDDALLKAEVRDLLEQIEGR